MSYFSGDPSTLRQYRTAYNLWFVDDATGTIYERNASGYLFQVGRLSLPRWKFAASTGAAPAAPAAPAAAPAAPARNHSHRAA